MIVVSNAACASWAATMDHTPAPLMARITPTAAKPKKYETVSAIAMDLKSRSRWRSASAIRPGPCSRKVKDSPRITGSTADWWKKSAVSGAPAYTTTVITAPVTSDHANALVTWRSVRSSRWTTAAAKPESVKSWPSAITIRAAATTPLSDLVR